uniref:Actin binding protein n=2 Tax=Clytia hemisphaerica TaxID=252671 RepID=A0A7M5WR27_9CNID
GPDYKRLPITYEEKNSQLRLYKYTPEREGHHNVQIKYKDQDIPKTPSVVNVKSDLTKIRIHSFEGGVAEEPVEFVVDAGSNSANITANVSGPNGANQSCDVTPVGDGKYKVRFTPRGSGAHNVSVAVNGKTLPGEPIQIPVEEKQEDEIAAEYDKDKHLYAELYERIGIAVDTQNSGNGSITAKTRGPTGNQVATDVDREEEGSFTVSFTPQVIGEYRTNVFWNDKEIQGSPFIVWVSDPTKIVSSGDGLKMARINEETHFEVETAGAGPGDLESYTECDGRREDVKVVKKNETLYDCAFRPDKVGVHNLYVNYNENPIKGSPFPVKVGDPEEVVVIPDQDMVVETSNEYSCVVKLTEDAGEGDVISKVRGPDGHIIPSQVKYISKANREVAFRPTQPGRHEMDVYYAGARLDGCPYYVNVTENQRQKVDPRKVRVTGPGITEGTVNEPSCLNVDARDAGPGHLSATVRGVRNDVVAGIRDNKDGTYDVTYTPDVPGAYAVDVKWDEEHVEGSPFKVTVENKPHPEAVLVGGDGIKEGTAGQPVTFHLDGRNAGPGQLSCRCRAPSGQMTYVLISDNKDGTYTVDLNASEPGLHTVEVEWDGQPIPGSPFLVRIMQAPDMKKVRAHGPGLLSGIINQFNGNFQVDSKGAGPGTMKVRIHGPKGAFKVEMYRDNPKDRSINVRYNPSEPGLYTANIYWSDEHIVGSPFEIFVAKNEQELNEWRRKAEQSHNGY